MRENYKWGALSEAEVSPKPIEQFRTWLEDAISSDLLEPNAMNLATVNSQGHPSSRIVLLKEITEEGFIFYTNYNSRKGREIEKNPNAALNFLWKEIQRQVRIEGSLTKVSRQKSEAYFHSRPIGSQLGAVTSKQSAPIKDRSELEDRYESLQKLHANSLKIPLPENWGGYLLKPSYFEFWQGREKRLHDRLEYILDDSGKWLTRRLEP